MKCSNSQEHLQMTVIYAKQLDKCLEEWANLSSLAQRIPFTKITAHPSGGQRAITGAVVNVPVHIYQDHHHTRT